MLPDNWLSEGRLPIQLRDPRTNIGDEYIQCTKAAKPADLWPPVLMSNAAMPHRWGVERGRNNNPSLHFSLFLLLWETKHSLSCPPVPVRKESFHATIPGSLRFFRAPSGCFSAVRYKETFRPSAVCPRPGDAWLRDANGDNAMLANPCTALWKQKELMWIFLTPVWTHVSRREFTTSVLFTLTTLRLVETSPAPLPSHPSVHKKKKQNPVLQI